MNRRKHPQRAINDYITQRQGDIPALLAELHAQAITSRSESVKCPNCKHEFTIDIRGGGNIEAIKWLLERHYGKAPQSLDIRSKSIVLTGEELSLLLPQLIASETLALPMPEIVESTTLHTDEIESSSI